MLVGTDTADDAGVYRLSEDLALVQTVDFFTPIVDDPYCYGQIAAANALSDIYAMGAKPLSALNIVCFPVETLPLEILAEILRGGADKAAEAGIPIIGGHTIKDHEPKYGLAVLGVVNPRSVVTNAGARPGDALVLTKPLGSGVASTAIKAGLATPELAQQATDSMATLNRAASEAMLVVGAKACTDITGFGLLGHLHEMTVASGVSAVVRFHSVPTLPGVIELIDAGVAPGGTYANRTHLASTVSYATEITSAQGLLLCDAQTSGGLLIAVAQDKAQALLDELLIRRVDSASIIGEIIADRPAGGSHIWVNQ